MKHLNIALIGYRFMGKAHSFGIEAAPFFFKSDIKPVKKVICGRTDHLVKQAAEDFGWEEYSTDWREIVDRDDIDIIDIATPTVNHREIAIAAAQSGKHIFCEKPLALSALEAKEMYETAEKCKVKHMLGHNYRRVPAIALAKKMIEEGRLGKLYHFRGVYLQDWIMNPNTPLTWQLDKNSAGAGPHFDLNSHLTDLARYLVGEIDQVIGMKETFIKQRPKNVNKSELTTMLIVGSDSTSAEYGEVTVDDAAAFLAKFKNGVLGTFEATRFAGGRKNYERIEINGSKGSIVFNFEKMNELEFWTNEDELTVQGFRKILVTEECHPYVRAWWPPGHIIGYENTFVNQFADFFNNIVNDTIPEPNFYDGLRNIQILEAVNKSVESGTWQKVDEV
jgi:predicted dehydrogenase